MHVCKVCEKQFEKNFARHLKVHYAGNALGKLAYFEEFYSDKLDIVYEYAVKKLSAARIAYEVSQIAPFPVQKNDILSFLSCKDVVRRDTSAAIKVWSEQLGGPWNKGHTKHTHSSVASYAMSRTGKNNPIFSLTEEERKQKVYYWLFKSKEELQCIHNTISKTLRDKYASGEILHISKTNPEKFVDILEKFKNGWKFAHENGLIKKQGYSSSYERKIADALENLNICFVQQKSINSLFRYDFFIPNANLLIEFNGDYWHCFPPLFESSYIHPHKQMLASEIWAYDEAKTEHAKSAGYNIVTVWENQLIDLNEEELRNFIYEVVKNCEHL